MIFGAAWLTGNSVIESLERSAYDIGVRGSSRVPGDKVAVIAIDDQSIANLGRWPWPRDFHAQMIETLSAGGAKVIGNLIFYSEPQIDPGLDYINILNDTYQASGIKIPDLEAQLAQAQEALDTDAILAEALRNAGNVVLPMTFQPGAVLGKPDQPLPDYIVRNSVKNVRDRIEAAAQGLLPYSVIAAETPPIEQLGSNAAAIGHMNPVIDVDGGNRGELLILDYYGEYYPSTALQLAARYLNLTPEDITINLGEGLKVGGLNISTNPYLQMYTFYYADEGDRAAFPVDSFFDVFTGNINAQKYAGKVALIGASATGIGNFQNTPVSSSMAPVVAMAHTVSSILNEDFFVVPDWAGYAEAGAFLAMVLYLVVLLPRLGAGMAAGFTVALFIGLTGTHYVLMTSQAMWLQLIAPATLLVVGHVLLTTKRFLMTERGKLKSEVESAGTNRILGLAHQGKGDLDAAFASFRKVPADQALMDLIYNLALDFERKRQFNKAGAACRHIADFDPKFRDIEARINRSQAMEETELLGAAGGGGAGATLLLDGGGMQKPMLGRYEIEKELGKGAMGIVYLGKDPKINRTVAIKTMALSQEFEDDELDEVKERFFREAESAGRLNHPNIVTIFDAGEEHDLA